MALYQNNKYHLLINITAGLYKRNECKQSTKPFQLDLVMLPRLSDAALLCHKAQKAPYQDHFFPFAVCLLFLE